MPQDQDLNGVHIFKAGTYTLTGADGKKETLTYSESDVQQMADNANALLAAKLHEPPAKLGHDEDQAFAKMAGLPAVGWVKRVVAKGMNLYADFSKVPAVLAEAIQRGRYRHISSEIYDPAQTAATFGDAVKGFTLRAVAFLGADVPVVKGMHPLMLAEGMHGAVVTIEVEKMAEPSTKPLMVPANRHAYGALVKMDGSDDVKQIHAVHPDGSYDAHDLHAPEKMHKQVAHDDLKLMSEKDMRALRAAEDTMEATKLAEAQATAAAATAKLAEVEAANAALLAKAQDDRIAAFSEKHKGLVKQPAILAAFKALAKAEAGAPVKLAEGKEPVSYLDGLIAFAESLIAAKPVLFGELAPVSKEGEMAKSHAAKMAEEDFKTYAEQHGNPAVERAELAVAARAKFSENPKVPYRTHLLAEAAKRLGKYVRGQYAEINPEVA